MIEAERAAAAAAAALVPVSSAVSNPAVLAAETNNA
jgi:hypothetical protein